MAKAVSQPTLRPSAEGKVDTMIYCDIWMPIASSHFLPGADTSTDLAFAQFDCLGDVLNSKDKEMIPQTVYCWGSI